VPQGEVDLIVARAREVVFCEVKSRTSTAFGQPVEAVTPTKQARLRRLAGLWLSADSRSWTDVRFDVACVLRGQVVEVIESAF
jgi:putative endonuclease